MKLKTKAQFVEAASKGLCGNVLKQFETVDELDLWVWTENRVATARAREKANTKLFIPEIDLTGVCAPVAEHLEREYPKHDWAGCYFQEVPLIPRLVNFELGRGTHYPLKHGNLPVQPWNLNLRYDLDWYGKETTGQGWHKWLSQWHLEDEYEHLEEIWELYPDAIIEATMFSKPCGTLNRKLVIWEVRDY